MERDKSFTDIVHGQTVGFSEIKPDDYFDTYEALRHGYFIGQYELYMPEAGLIGDLEVSSLHPIKTPEEQRLQRPSDTREGRRQSEIEAFDRNLEQMRISEIRGELAKV